MDVAGNALVIASPFAYVQTSEGVVLQQRGIMSYEILLQQQMHMPRGRGNTRNMLDPEAYRHAAGEVCAQAVCAQGGVNHENFRE